MQKLKFPMEYLRVTQGYGIKPDGSVDTASYSHAGTYAIDFGGKDTGSDKLYCPCDMIVKRCRQNANGELYLETVEPVLLADGTVDYVHLLFLHDSAFNVTEGQVISQGYYFYDEGGMGSGQANKFATHVHIEGGKGKWNSTTQSQNAQGVYASENMYPLHKMFILGDDVQILNDGGYDWKRESEFASSKIEDGVIYGVDVSAHRSKDIMESIIANGTAQFVIFRACVGSESEDANFAHYAKERGELKVGFYPANYFYSEEEAMAEADYLVDTIEKYGFTPYNTDLPLFCDWEGFSYEWNKNQGREIAPELLRKMTEAFCERIIERGYKAGVYLNKNFWDSWYGQAFFDAHPDYYIWYARPGLDAPDRECYLWQYACDFGAEYGVNESLDKNILMGEFIEISPIKWSYVDKYLEVTAGNCEFFGDTDVDAPLGKLQAGTLYKIIRITDEKVNGFYWAEFIFEAGDKAFVALLDDRCAVIDEPNIYKEEIENLMEENAELAEIIKSHEAVIAEKDKTIDSLRKVVQEANADHTSSVAAMQNRIDELTVANLELKSELANTTRQLDVAAAAHADMVAELMGQIEKLKGEIISRDEEIAALKTENENLKTQVENPAQQKDESLFASVLNRFTAWMKGV